MSLSYDELNKKVTGVNNKVNKFQTLLEENEKRMEELKKKAMEEYGVDNIEDLRVLLKKLLAEEETELNRVSNAIEQAEPVLKEIEEGLKELEV